MGRLEGDNIRLHEQLTGLNGMIDEKGWKPLYDYDESGGLSLGQIHASSKQLRELVVGNPFVGRGCQVRIARTWGAGVEFGPRERFVQPRAGAKSQTARERNLTARILDLTEHPRNLRYLFSPDAQAELETAAYTDGNLFALGDITTKTFQRIPVDQITADLRNPGNTEEIWAFRRVWSHNPNDRNMKREVRWYYTDIYDGERADRIQYDGTFESVDRTKTMIDKSFNRQIGWAYGAPDALSIIAWSRLYREFLVNGYIMSRALAQFAYKASIESAKGGQQASLAIARPNQAGSTYVGGDLTPIATAGKGYDFASGRPLAAAMAAGIGISLVELTNDPGSASGSNAVATSLASPSRSTAVMRRRSWDEWWARIFRFMGNSAGLKVTWHDLPEEQIQRQMEAWGLAHESGLFGPDVIQTGMANAMQISNPGPVPDDYQSPNERAKPTVSSQGVSDPVPGGSGTGNDHSTDTSGTKGE